MSSGNYESVFDNDSVRVKLADTEDGIELSLDLMEGGESTAGTTLYLGKEQIDGMCAWLDKYRSAPTEALPNDEVRQDIAAHAAFLIGYAGRGGRDLPEVLDHARAIAKLSAPSPLRQSVPQLGITFCDCCDWEEECGEAGECLRAMKVKG